MGYVSRRLSQSDNMAIPSILQLCGVHHQSTTYTIISYVYYYSELLNGKCLNLRHLDMFLAALNEPPTIAKVKAGPWYRPLPSSGVGMRLNIVIFSGVVQTCSTKNLEFRLF